MGTQVPDQQEQPWHAKFGLDEFVEHVEKLQKIVDSANSTKLWSIDKMKLKKMVGWGLFVEEVRVLSAAYVLQACVLDPCRGTSTLSA